MGQDPKNLKTGAELVDWWVGLAEKYPLYLLEDPCDENDFDSHAALTAKIGDKVEIVGDDLYCTNPTIVAKGLAQKATNAMLLKVNQIGSISEAIAAYRLCVDNEAGEDLRAWRPEVMPCPRRFGRAPNFFDSSGRMSGTLPCPAGGRRFCKVFGLQAGPSTAHQVVQLWPHNDASDAPLLGQARTWVWPGRLGRSWDK